MTETKINVKQLIIMGIHERLKEFSKFSSWENAFKYFKNSEFVPSNKDIDPGYFKYFWTKIVVDKALDDPKTKISKDVLRYSNKKVQANKTQSSNFDSVVQREPVVIKTFIPGNEIIDHNMFDSYLTHSEIDEIFSDDGGTMAATTYVLTGGPGAGKSTVAFWMSSRFKQFYPNKEIAVISSEMEKEDLLFEARKKPWMNSVEFILTSEYEDNLTGIIEAIFNHGYHIIILDSFADICDKLKEMEGMNSNSAEKYLLDQMKKSKGSNNIGKVYSACIVIQQQTKSGSFSGSNKLKHNTTGMLELRMESNGSRYMTFSKNRRCGIYQGKRLYYFLGANNQVTFDTDKWEREKVGDEDDDQPVNESSAGMDPNMLSQFGELSGAALKRAKLLIRAAGLSAEDIMEDEEDEHSPLPEGINLDRIYFDEALGMHVYDFEDGSPLLFDERVPELVAKIIDRVERLVIEEETSIEHEELV